MESGGFEWGWDALVAIGTIGLAIGTFLLAWSTRNAARATASEVRAQWRPAIAPTADVEVDYVTDTSDIAMMILGIRNVGRGAAYYVDAALDVGNVFIPASLALPGEWQPVNLAVLPVGEALDLHFTHLDERPSRCRVVIDYVDLNGHPYATTLEISDLKVGEGTQTSHLLRVERVEMDDGKELIPWKEQT